MRASTHLLYGRSSRTVSLFGHFYLPSINVVLKLRRLLSIVRSGTSTYSCPRCLVPSHLFHAPYDWPSNDDGTYDIRRTETYMKSVYDTARSYNRQGTKQKLAKVLKDHSTHMVKVFIMHRGRYVPVM